MFITIMATIGLVALFIGASNRLEHRAVHSSVQDALRIKNQRHWLQATLSISSGVIK